MKSILVLLFVFTCLHESVISDTTKSNPITTKHKANLKPTTTTDIFYDYSLVSNLTVISPANLTSESHLLSSTATTLPLVIDPKAQLNETIININTYIPEIQSEVSAVPQINFESCVGSACSVACTRAKLDLLAIDDYVCFNINLVSCNSQLAVNVQLGNETIYNDRFSVINPHCFISYEVPFSMKMFHIRFHFDNLVMTSTSSLTACITMEVVMTQLYSFSNSLGCFELGN